MCYITEVFFPDTANGVEIPPHWKLHISDTQSHQQIVKTVNLPKT